MRRICVVGCSGAGKTTLARHLARELELPHLELDSVYHQPGWEGLPTEELRARVTDFTSQSEWVIDGNYLAEVGDITWARTDTVIWVDTSRLVATMRVTRRTIGRVVLKKELWNGNREQWGQVFSRDPHRSIVAWAWKMHGKYAEPYEAAMKDPRWSHVRFFRLRTGRELQRFLRTASLDAENPTAT